MLAAMAVQRRLDFGTGQSDGDYRFVNADKKAFGNVTLEILADIDDCGIVKIRPRFRWIRYGITYSQNCMRLLERFPESPSFNFIKTYRREALPCERCGDGVRHDGSMVRT